VSKPLKASAPLQRINRYSLPKLRRETHDYPLMTFLTSASNSEPEKSLDPAIV